MADRTPAQIGKANREAGKRAERKVAQYLEAHGLGNGRRNLAGYTRDHGDYGPVTDRDGDLWAIEIKGPGSQPQPGQVEAWAAEAAREADHAGAPLWVLIVRRPGCADVGRWWAYLPLSDLWAAITGLDGPIANAALRTDGSDLACITLRTWVALVAPEGKREQQERTTMKPPSEMSITTGKTQDGKTVPAEVTITTDYCPCRWRCHSTPNPCSLSCTAHHPIDTKDEHDV